MSVPRRPHIVLVSALALAATAAAAAPAAGDGGRLRARAAFGSRAVSVWTSPTPLRVGPAEVLVVIEGTPGAAPAPAASIQVEAWVEGRRAASSAAVSGPEPRVLSIDLGMAGATELRVRVASEAGADEVRALVDVEPPLSPFREQWLALLLPFAAAALFAVRERARRRSASATAA